LNLIDRRLTLVPTEVGPRQHSHTTGAGVLGLGGWASFLFHGQCEGRPSTRI
jgi:hypothetical protein